MPFVIQLDAIFCRFEKESSVFNTLVIDEGCFSFLALGQSPA